MAKKLRRYRFKGLDRLSREQVRVNNTLLAHMPQTPFDSGFKDRVRQVIEPMVNVDVDIWLEGLFHVEPESLLRQLADPLCAGVISIPPRTDKIVVEVDLRIAQQAVDRMLGGAADDVDEQRPLSEIEEGVFAFMMLKLLRLVQQDYGTEQQVGFKLDGVVSDRESLKARVDVSGRWLALNLKLFFDIEVGYARVYLPYSLVGRDFTPTVPTPGPALSRFLKSVAHRLSRLAAVKTELVIEAGRISLSRGDLAQLESDDIILIDQSETHLVDGALQGRVTARVGEGRYGVIHGSLMVGETGTYEVGVEEILQLEEPPSRDAEILNEDEMEEHARKLSEADPTLARKLDGAWKERVRERLTRGQARSLAVGHDLDEGLSAEHSDEEYEGEYEDEEPMVESVNMLNDVAVSLVVEIGRVDVSAADVVALRPGQVIELGRAPGDTVDLVVDGKRIGKGELVEIEGELGVRILSLVR